MIRKTTNLRYETSTITMILQLTEFDCYLHSNLKLCFVCDFIFNSESQIFHFRLTMIQIGGLSTFSPLAALRIKSFFKGANSGIGIDLVLRRSEEDRCWFMEIAEKLLCI